MCPDVAQAERLRNVRASVAYLGTFEHMNPLARTSGLLTQRILHTKGFPPGVWGNVPERSGRSPGAGAGVRRKRLCGRTLPASCKGNFAAPVAL